MNHSKSSNIRTQSLVVHKDLALQSCPGNTVASPGPQGGTESCAVLQQVV